MRNSTKRKNKIIIITLIILAISFISTGIFLEVKLENETITINNAEVYCKSLYDEDGIPKDTINDEKLSTLLSKIEKINNKEKSKKLLKEYNTIKSYAELKNEIDSYYQGDIIKSDITDKDITKLETQNNKLSIKYRKIFQEKIDNLKNEYNSITTTQNAVQNLYSNYNSKTVKEDITREDYNEVIKLYSNIKQEDIKIQLKPYLDQVNNILTEKENKKKREEEQARQEAIKKAWIKLPVPYISQNENGVLNGCEAAALLMALKYKGYLQNTNLYNYATAMPKSDNPQTGFYLDIYGTEPTNISHWIAPEPLKNFGIASSGNNNIINATSWSLSQLDNEIKNNNPVIIYMTAKFKEPENWANGAPKNLHVQLLAGYNTITGEQLIVDPWKYKTLSSYWTISKANAENIYNKVGKKAVVVR